MHKNDIFCRTSPVLGKNAVTVQFILIKFISCRKTFSSEVDCIF